MPKAVPVNEVASQNVEALASTVATNTAHLDMLSMFAQADIVVKIVMLLLIASSFWSWAIIATKYLMYREVRKQHRAFEKRIWSGKPLEEQFDAMKDNIDSPLANVFVTGMGEWLDWKSRQVDKAGQQETGRLQMSIKDRINRTMDITRNREVSHLQQHLSFLATVGSTAPFIGLFGTVWGIMHSFQSIAVTQDTSLAVVAPGIAEALFATAIGLFAAIPAVIFYNKYTTELGKMADKMDDFADEFSAVISRELEGE